MKIPRIGKHLGSFLAFSACAALCAHALHGLDPGRLRAVLGGLGSAALWILMPMTLGIALESWGWWLVIRRAGYQPSFTRLWGVRFVTEAVGQSLPGGALLAESMKPALLARHAGLPLDAGVAATIHRKYLRLLAHGLYVAGAALFGAAALRQVGLGGFVVGIFAIGVGLFALATLLRVFFRRGRLAIQLLVLARRLPSRRLRAWLARGRRTLLGVDRETRRFFVLPMTELALPTALCLLAWLAEAAESWLILELLGVAPSLPALVACDVAVQLLRQLLVLLPAGWGVQDAGYLGMLALLGVPEPATVGAAFVLLKRARELAASGVGLGLWWASGRVRAFSEERGPATVPRGIALSGPQAVSVR